MAILTAAGAVLRVSIGNPAGRAHCASGGCRGCGDGRLDAAVAGAVAGRVVGRAAGRPRPVTRVRRDARAGRVRGWSLATRRGPPAPVLAPRGGLVHRPRRHRRTGHDRTRWPTGTPPPGGTRWPSSGPGKCSSARTARDQLRGCVCAAPSGLTPRPTGPILVPSYRIVGCPGERVLSSARRLRDL